MLQETNKESLGIHLNKPFGEERQGEVLANEQLMDEKAGGKTFYIESYGCAMNFSDSEIVASVLYKNGYSLTKDAEKANAIFINTCSIRENAEERVRQRLSMFRKTKQRNKSVIGVLGCMAERLKTKFLEEEKLVDIVCGPDAYRDLPRLLEEVDGGQKAVNVLLSREETYADISPIRLDSEGINAFISIMRGCDNMCSFCVVPFTRGRERSRNAYSIIAEAQDLYDRGYREVTLLGQNVDSYKWQNAETEEVVSFANLLRMVAKVHPDLRIRFSTSHPKDITDDVLYAIAENENVCNYIHLPIQSGNSEVLKRMNRTYDREWYMERVEAIRRIIPDCGISTDIITGFCGETEEQHQDTLSIMDLVQYDLAYTFYYSERPGTLAARKYEDDVPLEVKKRRLQEVVDKQRAHSLLSNQADVGKTFKVLIVKDSKRSDQEWVGRTDQNKKIIFPKNGEKPGTYVNVLVSDCTGATLRGEKADLVSA